MTQHLPEPGDTVAGKYRIERVLGAGGMGAVFEATHEVTGKRFAVKWLLPDLAGHADAVKRFIREAQVAGRFEHPNVVEVYDVGEERGSFFMVMELLHGESLAQRLRARGRLSPQEACALLVPCMHGVARAHKAGIVHRDLKPDNIFVCEDSGHGEHPKVLDFGISKMANMAGEVSPSITKTGMVMGTPHYMAPEQIRGKDMDHRVDVYAFGVIMYQLLSGWLPFPGDTYSELVLKIATEQPIALSAHNPTLPEGLVDIVSRAMARDPNARFQSLDELAEAIAPYAGGATAHLFRSGRPASGAHARKPTPSSGTIRLETPLSTQSLPPQLHELPAEGRGRPWLMIGLVAVSAAVIALVITAAVLLNRDPVAVEQGSPARDDQPAASTAAAAAPEVMSPTVAAREAAPAQEPVVNTVRVAPDAPQPERRWEPPPAAESGQAPAPPTAAAPREPAAQDHALEDEKPSKRRKKRDRELMAPPAPPVPSSPATTPAQVTTKPSAPATPAAPGAAKRVPGRLGVRMEETEF